MDDHAVEPRARQFLLLFYWEGAPPDLGQHREQERAEEFIAWARTLETRGELIAMETLAPDDPGTWLAGATGKELGGGERARYRLHLDRACVARARDREAAVESARHAPHLQDGGIIVVQEIGLD